MDSPLLVQQYIDGHLCRTPAQAVAKDDHGTLSYADLAVASNQLAHCLQDHGVVRRERVVFSLQRSVHCLTAILGILKADAAYVPLDPKTPRPRWQRIVADCQPSAIVCDGTTLEKVREIVEAGFSGTVICLGRQQTDDGGRFLDGEALNGYGSQPPDYRNRDDDVAYVMYTSGSTGQPKGVMVSHLNIKTYVDWAVEYLGLDATDRILGTAPFHFDMSTFDVFCTFKAGATLCVANDMVTLFPEKLVRFIEQHEVTTWKGVSSLLMYMARAGVISPERMVSLKRVLFAGESLPARYLMQWMSAYPEKLFVNAYGPTEATGVSLHHPVTQVPQAASERIPIGRPCKDTSAFLVDEELEPVPAGEIGELCIAGPCLAMGYLNDPVKTARAFICGPQNGDSPERYYRTGDLARLRDDGNFEFISRKDNQVKVMGYRIELGEIEHALLSITDIDDAAVVVEESGHGNLVELVGYFESSTNRSPPDILMELRKLLPAYMVPKRVLKVATIPRSDRGKIARDVLSPAYAGVGSR